MKKCRVDASPLYACARSDVERVNNRRTFKESAVRQTPSDFTAGGFKLSVSELLCSMSSPAGPRLCFCSVKEDPP
ncbi:hypothetical protein Q5P01_025789 [Channa striata]|uniref:Uncharacterized protein n=1 Tax=Channa striata TaxID=64152 RepID=A0AA88IRI0_CHASR|nr:hypothetical protein Q5P01_025789 [Channa striata]